MKQKLLLDIDGVVVDFTSEVIRIHSEKYPNDQFKPIDEWHFYTAFTHADKMYDLMEDDTMHGIILKNAPAYPEALEDYNKLISAYDVQFVTSRKEIYRDITVASLSRYGFVLQNPVIFTSDKESVPGNILIDDNISFLDKFTQSHQDRIGIALDRPWNQKWGGPRIGRLKEMVEKKDWKVKYVNN